MKFITTFNRHLRRWNEIENRKCDKMQKKIENTTKCRKKAVKIFFVCGCKSVCVCVYMAAGVCVYVWMRVFFF